VPAYQSYYEILGLDAPPEDRKTVKRAYSKLLKVTRPEDDPDGFMRLRDAHDTALQIVARKADESARITEHAARMTAEPDDVPDAQPSLTYEDMIPADEPASPTSYSIGPTPNLDAPVESAAGDKAEASGSQYSIGPTLNFDAPILEATPQTHQDPSPVLPLLDDINYILSDPKRCNDRELWNALFRKARRLDIDDYVDFEKLLLEQVLNFHGYYDQYDPSHDTPEKMPQKLTPSIAASLFKTMSWDQVNTQGFHRGQQIDWLNRRMRVRKRAAEAVPIASDESGSFGGIWAFLFIIFIIAKIALALANS